MVPQISVMLRSKTNSPRRIQKTYTSLRHLNYFKWQPPPDLKRIKGKQPQQWIRSDIQKILDTTYGNKGIKEEKAADERDVTQHKEDTPKHNLKTTEISTEITVNKFIPGIKIRKEQTSTSPSGCHSGHYKAIIRDKNLANLLHNVCSPLQIGLCGKKMDSYNTCGTTK